MCSCHDVSTKQVASVTIERMHSVKKLSANLAITMNMVIMQSFEYMATIKREK